VYGFVSQNCDVKSFSLCFLFGVFMSIIDKLFKKEIWDEFLNHKIQQGNISEKDIADFRDFIDNEEYIPVATQIKNKNVFWTAQKNLINKTKAGRKRTVYTLKREENYVLKLMAYLLRDYDYLFSPNLYSFRKNSGVKKATEDVLKIKDLDGRYVYKVDISDYFNSVNVDILLPELKKVLNDDLELYEFFDSFLTNPYVLYNNELIKEYKGIMAGIPTSAFLANFYLRDLDDYFYRNNIPYIRYSDDILVFAEDKNQLDESIDVIKKHLDLKKLAVNPDKEIITNPNEKWTFLGFSYHNGTIDISEVSFEKLKSKMRRKTRALSRWVSKKKLPGEYAAKAFIKRFNAKLYDNPVYSELTWTRWFFPIINTDKTLKKIDEYMQECIRYLATGKRTKSRYNYRYDEFKNIGYRNLVNEYYKFRNLS